MIHRIEFTNGGRRLGGGSYAEANAVMQSQLVVNAGRVGVPTLLDFDYQGNRYWEVWELGKERAMILGGHQTNPCPELLG